MPLHVIRWGDADTGKKVFSAWTSKTWITLLRCVTWSAHTMPVSSVRCTLRRPAKSARFSSGKGGRATMLHIVCFGNLWQGDDGFGMHVFQRLAAMRSLPPQVQVFDAGTAGLSALSYFDNCSKAVIVDAIQIGGQIGSVYRLHGADLDLSDQEFSLHGIGVNHLLTVLPVVFEGRTMPEVVVIAAEIGAIHPFTDILTPPVEAAVEKVINLVHKECMNSV